MYIYIYIHTYHTYSFQYIISITTEFHEQSYLPACVTVDSIYLGGKKNIMGVLKTVWFFFFSSINTHHI